MTNIITRSIASQFAASIDLDGSQPIVTTKAVTSLAVSGDSFQLGLRFHALLRRIEDHGPLTKGEKSLLPYLTVVRDELRRLGVTYLTPEVSLTGRSGLPNSRCDLLLAGGLAKSGVAEIKVTQSIPTQPLDKHLMQLAIYEELAALNGHGHRLWGCIVYVSFQEKRVRFFAFRDVTNLRRGACALFAA